RAYLTGRGPLEMEDDQKLVELQGLVDKALGHLEALAEQTASVEIGYAQNAAIRCSGSVTITGKACYHSTIEAGTDIKGPICVIRGGRVTSHNGNIEVREMGSPQGAPTQARVGS